MKNYIIRRYFLSQSLTSGNSAKKRSLFFLILLTSFNYSCKKFIDVGPPSNQLIKSVVFEDDVTANGAMIGLYSSFINTGGFSDGGTGSITFLGALSADELIYRNTSVSYLEFLNNNLLSTNPLIPSFWDQGYSYIYKANSIIEGLQTSKNVSGALKSQLLGEATFIRAFTHFYLVNLFGKIPYIKTTEYEQNNSIGRMDVPDVYQQIIEDLQNAKSLLSENYSISGNEKTRVNSYVVAALLARVYLFNNEWAKAETESSYVINASGLFNLTDLNSTFLKNSKEAIWQLMVRGQTYTNEGQLFLYPGSATYSKLRDELLESFELGDERRNVWVTELDLGGSTFFVPHKYKDMYPVEILNEYSMILRLGEQYLIRAEARAQQDKVIGLNSAESDLNMIRNRAKLDPTKAATKNDMLGAILAERRVELFIEWGHRWLDLKRTMKADEVLSILKPSWDVNDKLYPIPRNETLINPNMTQNPNY